MKINRLVVGRGRTTKLNDTENWAKEYYEIEVIIETPAELEAAKANLTGLIDGWLFSSMSSAKRMAQGNVEEEAGWNPSKIVWRKAEGTSGPYERSEDVNNLDFKALVKDLAAHGGKLTRDGTFYWLFKNGATVGRKKRG